MKNLQMSVFYFSKFKERFSDNVFFIFGNSFNNYFFKLADNSFFRNGFIGFSFIQVDFKFNF